MTAAFVAAQLPPAGPKLCRICAFALDPVVADLGVHMNCEAAPHEVPKWRRDGAEWLRRRAAARLAGAA
jgi:hypothetical protein